MKISFLIIFLCVYGFAQESKGKIDMHGGKEQGIYEKKSEFKNPSFGISVLKDTNATQQKKPTQK
jgi:hypothetical protein